MSYLLNDMEKWAGDRETFQLSREELNRKIDMRNRTLWHDARDIEAGMMPPKEKIKPKFQTIKKRSFTHLTEDSDYADKHLEKSNKRRVRRQEFIMEKHRKISQAKQEARDKESEEMWASYERDLKKERRNQLIKPIALAGIAGAAAIGGGAYLYHRYKKKKRAEAEQEKTAGFMGRFDQWQNKKVHNVLENRIDRSDKVKPGEDFKKILPKGHESFKLKPSQFEDKKDYYRWKLWHHEYFDETSNDTFLRDEGEWNPSYLADYDDPELIDAYHAVNGRKTKLGGIALANKGLKKTAATKPSFKKLYESDNKLKDTVFGAYKKGPDKGANKFNVAYKKKQILKSWKNDVYKSDEVLDGKIQQRHKDNYDDAFVEAAARPVAIAAGTGAAIYGGKKLLDRYNKRQAEKKEQNYYV